MKYTILYRCRDFFIDNCDTVEEYASPLLTMVLEEDARDASKKREVMQKFKSKDNSLPFAKLKSSLYTDTKNITANSVRENDVSSGNSLDVITKKTYFKNKIIYLGKLSNISLLQKERKIPAKFDESHDCSEDEDIEMPQSYIEKYKQFIELFPDEPKESVQVFTEFLSETQLEKSKHVCVKKHVIKNPVKYSYEDYKKMMLTKQ